MKLHLLNRSSLENHSFSLTHNQLPHFLNIWHYHPELELIYLQDSTGTRFIGDSIEKFEPGDIVLIGKNVPHMWQNDEPYFEESSHLVARAIGIHFAENFLGEHFFQAPEMRPIGQLFRRAQRGIHFISPKPELALAIQKLLHLPPFEQTMQFLHILYQLAHHQHYSLLASAGFMQSFSQSESRRLDKVYAFVLKNFKEPIGSREAAEFTCMHPSAFSRLFKRLHHKSFTRYLNEVRIGYACKLLMQEEHNIAQICYEAGYNNISNFNRQFKKIKDMSPSEYIQYHRYK